MAVTVSEQHIIEDHNAYHRAITGKEAEKRLKKCGSHCYLTRYSDKHKCYVLTVYEKNPNNVMKHFEIAFEHFGGRKEYKLKGKENEVFDGIGAMLHHYETHTFDPALTNIGRCITEQEYMSKWDCIIL